jgi:hypothetical protein
MNSNPLLRQPWNIGEIRAQLSAEMMANLQPQEDQEMEFSEVDSDEDFMFIQNAAEYQRNLNRLQADEQNGIPDFDDTRCSSA